MTLKGGVGESRAISLHHRAKGEEPALMRLPKAERYDQR